MTAESRGPDPLREERELLLRNLAFYRMQVQRLEKSLQELNSSQEGKGTSGNAQDALQPVVKDEYKGMILRNAIETYLRARRGHRISFERVVSDLLLAGVDPGLPRLGQSDPVRLLSHNLKILMALRRNLIAWEPQGKPGKIHPKDLTIWLAPSADELHGRRARNHSG
jgi:hypothetical protein